MTASGASGVGEGRLEVGERDALADRMAIAARGGEADHAAVGKHRLVAVGVGVGGVDDERHELLARRLVLLAQRSLATDEVGLGEVDEAREAGLGRRDVRGVLAQPGAEAFFQA